MKNLEYLYLFITVLIWFAGYFHTGRFVRPKWKIAGKFIFYTTVSFALANWFAYWALLFIIGHPLVGLIFHIKACRKNGINWLTCEPREKYMALQEKWAKGNFSHSNEKG